MGLPRAIRPTSGGSVLLGLLLLLAVFATSPAAASGVKGLAAFSAPKTAEPPFSVRVERSEDTGLALTWSVAPGTYLYRDHLEAWLDGRKLPLDLPAGEMKDDPLFGRVEVYPHTFTGRLAAVPAHGRLNLGFQGCSQEGICFPPEARTVALDTLTVSSAAPTAVAGPVVDLPDPPASIGPAAADGTGGDPAPLFADGFAWTMLAFFGFGLLLSVTPCVFPMVPILAGMLVGRGGTLSPRRGLALTGVYVLAMATAYGLVGAVAGWSGANLQAALQTPLVLGLGAAMFVALALSMFGLFELALPAGLGARLAGRSGRSSFGGAALLGFGSALIVGPCVTPPLAGAMLYAAATGDVLTGAAALFMLGLGMGLPLLLVGAFGPALLPKAGPWLARAKQVFGLVFLAVAVMLAGRLLPPAATLALLGVLLIAGAVMLGGTDPLTEASGTLSRLARGAGLAAIIYGATLIIGAAAGSEDPLRPLAFLRPMDAVASAPATTRVTTLADFERALARARQDGPVLVDFTADWCTICKANAAVMATPGLAHRLARLPRISADVTTTDAAARALMQRFAVIGPPTLFVMDKDGREVPGTRIVGPVTADDMARRLDAAGT
ncbi:protein-disulfide reductase DsbD [Aquabacter sp. L1I39]|uniref:protein-disulfide reductase DsbD n=1 Tax=Aquabacter sp. L1I39 TaxID=2820278 RepID=UPI001ADBF551|nr:protein-disulfide reductase DsbD [Aquabacter sp. L1I39]QTL03737.1 protein-disulfide reductase DsbD [Aquabacter sp. L1I39]